MATQKEQLLELQAKFEALEQRVKKLEELTHAHGII